MADEFQSGICGGSWWNAARSAGFDGTSMSAGAASVPSTATTADAGAGSGGAFSWSGVEVVEVKAKSFDHEPTGSASGSSITFQDTHKGHPSDHMMGGQFMDPSLQIPTFGLSTPTMDWNQALLRSSGRAETSFHAMLQDDLSSRPFFHQDPSINSDQVHTGAGDSPANPYRDMNQSFLLDQHHLSSSNEPGDSTINSFPSTMVLQGLFEQDTKPQQQQAIYDNRSVNYQAPMMGYRGTSSELPPQSSWPKFPPFLKPSPPKQQPTNQLQFSNNTPFWNASAASVSDVRSSFYPPMPTQFAAQTFEQKPSCSSPTTKSNSEGARESSSSTAKKSSSSSSEPAFKKPRIETPSPLPTFKVRKEKLGDRITALQQLVSPFGKTDTASVLHEAIEYIKFLHDQVSVLSTPYLKNGNPMQHQQSSDKSKDAEGPKQDLRSRGLCLVPVQITYPVASEPQADFWTPTFGGTYR